MAARMPCLTPARRCRLGADVAAAPRFMPECGRRLYPRVFVAWRAAARRFDVRFIDLEKTHRVSGFRYRFRDLDNPARRLAAKRPQR